MNGVIKCEAKADMNFLIGSHYQAVSFCAEIQK